jgi:hypothetical protein
VNWIRNKPEVGPSAVKLCKVAADLDGVRMISFRSRMDFSPAADARKQEDSKVRPTTTSGHRPGRHDFTRISYSKSGVLQATTGLSRGIRPSRSICEGKRPESFGRTAFVSGALAGFQESESQTMNRYQLEIAFESKVPCRRPARRSQRMTRARWWFGQMRQVVDHTLEWRPLPVDRPQQECLPWQQADGE